MKNFLRKVNLRIVALILSFWSCLFVIMFLKNSHREYPLLRPPLDPSTLNSLKNFIHSVNTRQLVYNKNKDTIDLVIVIRVHDNVPYLRELITSLSETPEIESTLLIFSHDLYRPEINHLIYNITFTKTMQIFYPFSTQTHQGEFPGPSKEDFTGSTWRNATQAQEKHNWWWKVNFVFNRVKILSNFEGLVLFLEENDHLKQDFLHCLFLMSDDYAPKCPQCWFFALAPENPQTLRPRIYNIDVVLFQKNLETLGLAFNRTTWNEISKLKELFCKYDDYDWARTLKHLTRKIANFEMLTMTLASPRLYRGYLSDVKSKRFFEDSEFPKFFNKRKSREFINEIENQGGWGARDRALCMGM